MLLITNKSLLLHLVGLTLTYKIINFVKKGQTYLHASQVQNYKYG